MKIYNELESLGFFEWLSETYNLKDTDMKPEYLDELPLNDIHRTVGNSMAFRWFREKHCLYPSVISHDVDNHIFTITGGKLYESDDEQDNFDSYKEAEQACLDKLIEICKTK